VKRGDSEGNAARRAASKRVKAAAVAETAAKSGVLAAAGEAALGMRQRHFLHCLFQTPLHALLLGILAYMRVSLGGNIGITAHAGGVAWCLLSRKRLFMAVARCAGRVRSPRGVYLCAFSPLDGTLCFLRILLRTACAGK
jgi:hypothetical protein